MAKNKDLSQAKDAKKDEFYTQLDDIAKELRFYKSSFKDKVVFCNCNDSPQSNFFIYFALNFNFLGLKKLITTYRIPADGDTFLSYKIELNEIGDVNGDGAVNMEDVKLLLPQITTPINDADFRSEDSIGLLQQADIVVTNPPFSLFREFLAQLVAYNKSFLIIGNVNAISYKECFPLIKENKLWLGQSIHSGDREFQVPEDYPLNAAGTRIDEQGRKYIRVKGVRWFTNIDYSQRHEDLILYKHYSSEEYPKYDNYDAINVNLTTDIPDDYNGIMGVPITFLDKYNPEQFEIIGSEIDLNIPKGRGYINGKRLYSRIFIRKKQ